MSHPPRPLRMAHKLCTQITRKTCVFPQCHMSHINTIQDKPPTRMSNIAFCVRQASSPSKTPITYFMYDIHIHTHIHTHHTWACHATVELNDNHYNLLLILCVCMLCLLFYAVYDDAGEAAEMPAGARVSLVCKQFMRLTYLVFFSRFFSYSWPNNFDVYIRAFWSRFGRCSNGDVMQRLSTGTIRLMFMLVFVSIIFESCAHINSC